MSTVIRHAGEITQPELVNAMNPPVSGLKEPTGGPRFFRLSRLPAISFQRPLTSENSALTVGGFALRRSSRKLLE